MKLKRDSSSMPNEKQQIPILESIDATAGGSPPGDCPRCDSSNRSIPHAGTDHDIGHPILTYLLSKDFKKHIDLVELVNYKGFQLTDKEEAMPCNIYQALKVLKILMYKIGISEETNQVHRSLLTD